MNHFISDYQDLRKAERKNRKPQYLATLAIIACIPLLYCWIFIASMKDPYGQLPSLPVALVDRDLGVDYRGKEYKLGLELSKTLIEQKPVDFIPYADEEEAQAAVRSGSVYFALILPEDFSARAMAADGGEKAKIQIYVSQGGNYFASRVAQSLADKIADSVNAQLGKGRWEAVGAALPQLSAGIGTLKAATDKLAEGSASLAKGSATLSSGASRIAAGLDSAAAGSAALASGSGSVAQAVGKLADGVGQLGRGIKQLDAAAPSEAQLAPLTEGALSLASGSAKLSEGLGKLALGVEEASTKAGLFGAGLKQVYPRIKEAAGGAGQVAEGNKGLAIGVSTLAGGVGKIKGALDTMSAKLPGEGELATLKEGAARVAEKNGELAAGIGTLSNGASALADGAAALAEGASALAGGLGLMRSRLPSSIDPPSGDAASLAASVAVEEKAVAAVAGNGEAFAPYAIAISLWIGMLMATFVFNYRREPGGALGESRDGSRLAFVAQKLTAPALLAAAQALILFVGIAAMGIPYAHPFFAIAAQATAGLCYLCVIFTLVTYLGDAGKLLSVILLVLQIGASGGSFPIELSPPFFRAIHDYLPISDAITALRFGLSGAYEGRFGLCLIRMAATVILMLGLSLIGGRAEGAVAGEGREARDRSQKKRAAEAAARF
jgi:putative membrane protein